MIRSRLKLIVPALLVLVLVAGGAYRFLFSDSSAEAKPKVEGEVYVLPKEFLVNLADERYAKLNVGLVLKEPAVAGDAGGHGGGTKPPEGFGPLPEEALVRDIVTDALTASPADALVERSGRQALKRRLVRSIQANTDVRVERVLFTDVTVQ